jgi:hypothetical protein
MRRPPFGGETNVKIGWRTRWFWGGPNIVAGEDQNVDTEWQVRLRGSNNRFFFRRVNLLVLNLRLHVLVDLALEDLGLRRILFLDAVEVVAAENVDLHPRERDCRC